MGAEDKMLEVSARAQLIYTSMMPSALLSPFYGTVEILKAFDSHVGIPMFNSKYRGPEESSSLIIYHAARLSNWAHRAHCHSEVDVSWIQRFEVACG